MKSAPELTVLQIKNLPPGTVRAVGGVPGLKVCVSDSGLTRSWILRVQVGAKRREIGLGGFPAVSLSEAREKARRMRLQAVDGIDPLEDRNSRKAALVAKQQKSKSFEQCAREYVESRRHQWSNEKHRTQWINTLEQYAFPILGPLPISHVGKKDVLAVLEQQCRGNAVGTLWDTKTETASRLRGRIESVLDWATFHEHRHGENPARWAGYLVEALVPPSLVKATRGGVRHHPSLPLDLVPGFFRELAQQPGTVAQAFRFLILTACRSGEVRGAQWNEVNFQRGLWTIPARRMKARREHRVPLSTPALQLLRSMQDSSDCELVFPSARGTPLCDMAFTAYMRRAGHRAVPHGFRSTFRNWAAENDYSFEVSEAALAHTLDSKVVSAYLTSDFFEKRRAMMENWAKHCTGERPYTNETHLAA